jgi:predicted lipoprotein with Yx(FWY)xxD motif
MSRTGKIGSALLVGASLGGATLMAGAVPLASPAAAANSKGHALSLTKEHVAKVGNVLATSSGFTLYRYASDPSGMATCTGNCAKIWPPLLLPKGDTKVKGPKGLTGFSTIHTANGRLQAAFHGQALYRFYGDTKKARAKGQGVEGAWFAELASNKISTGSPTTTSTTSPAATTPGATTPTPTTTKTTTKTTSPPATSPPSTTPPATTTPPTSPPTTTTTAPPGGGGVGF